MKKLLYICVSLPLLFLWSCKKETTIDDEVIKTLTIDSSTHSFIGDDGNHYLEDTLIGQTERHVYKLDLVKYVEYRILAYQPNRPENNISLTLVDNLNDTLATAEKIDSKGVIILTSPATKSYYLIINHLKQLGSRYLYRLFFEEMIDNTLSFAGKEWQYNGIWEVNSSNQITMIHNDSRIFRHLKLTSALYGKPTISFIIQSTVDEGTNFGVLVSGSDNYLKFSDYTGELPDYGKAIVTDIERKQIILINIHSTEMSCNSLLLSSMDYTSGIRVKLVYNITSWGIYINDILITDLGFFFPRLYILIQDSGFGTTTIKDFAIN